jgi:hypothetical protein
VIWRCYASLAICTGGPATSLQSPRRRRPPDDLIETIREPERSCRSLDLRRLRRLTNDRFEESVVRSRTTPRTPKSGRSAIVSMALSGDQVMARAVVTPRPPMVRAIRTSSDSLTICRPWSE